MKTEGLLHHYMTVDFINVLYLTSVAGSNAANIKENFSQAINSGVTSRSSLKIPSNMGRFSAWLSKGLRPSSEPHITKDIRDTQVKQQVRSRLGYVEKEKGVDVNTGTSEVRAKLKVICEQH